MVFVFALLAFAAMAATQFLDKGEYGISAMNENVSGMLASSHSCARFQFARDFG